MLKDISISNTTMREFSSHIQTMQVSRHLVCSIDYVFNLLDFFKISLSGMNLSVKVLTAGVWPTQSPAPKYSIPSVLSNAFEVFRR